MKRFKHVSRRHLRLAFIGLISTPLVLSFQNCSKTSPGSVGGSGVPIVDMPISSITSPNSCVEGHFIDNSINPNCFSDPVGVALDQANQEVQKFIDAANDMHVNLEQPAEPVSAPIESVPVVVLPPAAAQIDPSPETASKEAPAPEVPADAPVVTNLDPAKLPPMAPVPSDAGNSTPPPAAAENPAAAPAEEHAATPAEPAHDAAPVAETPVAPPAPAPVPTPAPVYVAPAPIVAAPQPVVAVVEPTVSQPTPAPATTTPAPTTTTTVASNPTPAPAAVPVAEPVKVVKVEDMPIATAVAAGLVEAPPQPEKRVCQPFTSPDAKPYAKKTTLGVMGELYYATSGTSFSNFADLKSKSKKSDMKLYFDRLFVPTVAFSRGFVSESGTPLTADGKVLLEYFGVSMKGQFQVAAQEDAGIYQIAVISDDGSNLRVLDSKTNKMVTVINNDGNHATKMGCTTQTIALAPGDKIPFELDYYQGPRYHIAMALIWRKILPGTNMNDTLCGQTGSGTFWNADKTPSAATGWAELQKRGWKPIEASELVMPEKQVNPCNEK